MNLVILGGLTGSGKSTLLTLIVSRFGFRKVEIDDIKIKKYGTTTICEPKIDFVEAGQQAGQLLLSGYSVVVEEAFLDQIHIQYFLQGLKCDMPTITYVRTECSVETAINRKKDVLDPEVVRRQYLRHTDEIEGELIFDTDKFKSTDIVTQIGRTINLA